MSSGGSETGDGDIGGGGLENQRGAVESCSSRSKPSTGAPIGGVLRGGTENIQGMHGAAGYQYNSEK